MGDLTVASQRIQSATWALQPYQAGPLEDEAPKPHLHTPGDMIKQTALPSKGGLHPIGRWPE